MATTRYGTPISEARQADRSLAPATLRRTPGAVDLRQLPGPQAGAVSRGTAARPGEFARGLQRGAGSTAAALARATGAAARAVGAEELAERPEQFARDVEERLVAPAPGRVTRLEDINTDDVSSLVSDAGDYLAGLFGSQVPVLGGTVAGAAAGGLVGGLPGAAAGAGAVSAAQQAGETAGAIEEDLGRPLEQGEAATALGAGALGGALDVLPAVRAARVLGVGGPMRSAVRRGLLSRAGREAATQAGLEGTTEGLQQVIQRGARQFVNDNFDALGPEAASELMNAVAAGALVGGGLGGITGALSRPEVGPTVDEDLEDLAAEDGLRAAERDRLVDQLRQTEAVGERYLNEVASEPFVDETLLEEIRSYLPSDLREQRDLEYQDFVSSQLSDTNIGQLAEREPALLRSYLERLGDRAPELSSLIRSALEGTGAEVEPEPGASSLADLQEGSGDAVLDYFSLKTRHPRQGEWVGDNQTGGFFRDSEHVATATQSLEEQDPNTRFDRVPAREVLRAQGLEEADLNTQRAAALQELQSRTADPKDRLTAEQLARVRPVAGAIARGQPVPEGTPAGVERAARRLAEDPLSVFDGRFALVPTSAPRAFVGDDPLALGPQQLRPPLTKAQLKNRQSDRAKPGADRDKVDQKYRNLRERNAIVRTPNQFKRNPNQREAAVVNPEGKERFLHMPNLVRQMVRAQRRLSGRNFDAQYTPQEIVDGAMLGLAELKSQGYQFNLIPDDTVVWNAKLPDREAFEPVTWGEVSRVGLERLTQRGKALSSRIQDADARIAELDQQLAEEGLSQDRRDYLGEQRAELESLKEKGPGLLTKQRRFFSEYRAATNQLLQGGSMDLPQVRQTLEQMEELGEGAEAEGLTLDREQQQALRRDELATFLSEGGETMSGTEGVQPDPFAGVTDPAELEAIAAELQRPPVDARTPNLDDPRTTVTEGARGFQHIVESREQQRELGEEVAEAIAEAIVRTQAPREAANLSTGAAFDEAVRDVGEAPTHQQDKRMVKQWATQLGLPEDTKLMSTAEVMQVLRERGDIGRLYRIRTGDLNGLAIGNAVWVHPSLTGQARLEVLAHELGHVIASATAPQRSDSVYEAWQAWRQSQEKPGVTLRDVAASKQAFFTAMNNFGRLDEPALAELSPAARSYVLDFEEWFSDQVARHLAGNPSPSNETRGWMERFIEGVKKLFGLVREQGFKADPNVVEFLTRMTVREPIVYYQVREQADASADPESIYAFLASTQVESDHGFNAARSWLTFAEPSLRQALGRVFASDGRVRRDIARTLRSHDRDLQAIAAERHVDHAIAYGMQLWAHGELEVGPRTTGVLGRMRDALFAAAGQVSEDQQAMEALEALKHSEGSTWVISKVRRDTALQRSGVAAGELWNRWLGPVVERIVLPATSRMENTGNPYLIELSRMFHSPPGEEVTQESYLAAKSRNTAGFLDRVFRAYGRKPSAELLAEVNTAMQRGEAAPSEEGRAAQAKLRVLLDDVFNYMSRAGTISRKFKREDYYPRVWDVEVLQDNADRFREAALNPAYTAEWQGIVDGYQVELDTYDRLVRDATASGREPPPPTELQRRALDLRTRNGELSVEGVVGLTYRVLVNEYGFNDLDLEYNAAGRNPFVAARNKRALDFLFDGPERDTFFELLSTDADATMRAYIQSVVKRTELDRLGGVQRVQSLMQQAREAGASQEELALASDFVEAMQGTLGHETARWVARLFGLETPEPGTVMDPRLQRLQSALLLWQNFRVLAFAGFTSLADPVGVLVRGGGLDTTQAALGALRANSHARVLAEAIGIVNTYSINEALGGVYGTNYMVGKTQAWNERFFKWTGLELITRTTRVMATGAGSRFIVKHATDPDVDSQRFLGELGLEAADVRTDEQGELQLLTRAQVDALYAENTDEALAEAARDLRVRGALNKFVDESVLRPTAATRPIWASDPHAALVFHLKSFIYTFHSQILSRVWKEAINRGNATPMALASVYVPAMIAADLLRDFARHGPEGDPRKQNWGVMEWSEHGFERAGLPGLASFLLDAQQDRAWGGIGIESALGPTAGSLIDLAELALEGGEGAYDTLLDQLPGSNTPMVDVLR